MHHADLPVSSERRPCFLWQPGLKPIRGAFIASVCTPGSQHVRILSQIRVLSRCLCLIFCHHSSSDLSRHERSASGAVLWWYWSRYLIRLWSTEFRGRTPECVPRAVAELFFAVCQGRLSWGVPSALEGGCFVCSSGGWRGCSHSQRKRISKWGKQQRKQLKQDVFTCHTSIQCGLGQGKKT